MRPLRTAVIATTLVAVPVTAIAVAAGPAAAHTHPTPVELVAPAVVRVETFVEVNISLIEHGFRGAHIGLHQKKYTPMLAAGSGFAVDPTGGIVTSREVTDVDLHRAEIYAVNQIFQEQYGPAAPLPDDPFTMHEIPGGDPVDKIAERLQECYNPNHTDSSGGCVIFSQRVVRVLPFVSSQALYGNLQATVLEPKEGQPGDVVVLKVGASSMPAARLATSVRGRPFSVLGFTTAQFKEPLTQQSLSKLDGHLARPGSSELDRGRSEDDKPLFPALVNGMGAGVAGGPAVGENGEVIGFLIRRPGGSPSDLTLVDPAAIRAALGAAKIFPHSGPTDSAYESALHNYKNKLYAASIPSLAQTLKLYPGHALATEALAQANRMKGTAEDLTGRAPQAQAAPAGGGVDLRRTVLPLVVAAIVLAALAVAVVLLLRRRRRSATEAVADPAGEPPPVVVPAPTQQSSAGRASVATARRQATMLRPRPVATDTSGATPAAGPAAGCPVCGTPAGPGQTFCAQCGQRLA
jgi:hypothetical protein